MPTLRLLRHPLRSGLRVGLSLGFLIPAVAAAQTVQEMIDAAAPGDTVLVPSGVHSRAFSVDKAITLLGSGPTPPRVVGLTGSGATIIGLAFDGSLGQKQSTLVLAGPDLTFRTSTFSAGIRGVEMIAGARNVRFEDCTFDGLLEAISLDPDAESLELHDSRIQDCTLGVISTAGFTCVPPAERTPADRCTGSCREIVLRNTRFEGGDRHIDLAGDYLLDIAGSEFRNPATFALRLTGARLEMTGTDVVSTGGSGTGLDLTTVSGFIVSSRVLSWNEGIVAGDGGCTLYSDLVIGNSREAANDIGNQLFNIRLAQPEALAAAANFWGTVSCAAVNAKLSGQTVPTITDETHQILIPCGPTPVDPTTWGRLKTRYQPGSGS